jgi:Xaa-Pro dipeptidase
MERKRVARLALQHGRFTRSFEMQKPCQKLAADAVRVDHARLHRDRLQRARDALRRHGLPAALLFDPLNVRYVSFSGIAVVANLHLSFRWALVPIDSKPIVWEYAHAMHGTPSYWEGELRPASEWQFFGAGLNTTRQARALAAEIADALRERGLGGETIGVDRLETVGYLALAEAGIGIADAQPAVEEARAVKTTDELTILRQNAHACDAAIRTMLSINRPGVTENELWATFIASALKEGAEWCETRLLSSGPRTNPWFQEATNRVVQEGELFGLDTDLVGEHGYLTDISRTYLCGDAAPTDEQRRLYSVAYDYIHENILEFRPGASFEELGHKLGPRLPEEFQAQRYGFIAHGSGMADEYPCVKFEHHHDGELEAGMVMSVEAYVGAVGGKEGVKLEDQIIVTDQRPEVISNAPYDERLLG